MQDLLTRGIDEQGDIRSEKTHELKPSTFGKIPVNWKVVSIKDIAEYIGSGVTPRGGANVYQPSGIMLVRSQNVLSGEFNLTDVAFISEEINNKMKRSEIYENDVLVNITGASIGRSCFVPNNFPRANVNQHVCAIRLKGGNQAKASFLSSFLNSSWGQNQIFRLNAGSNREGLNYSQVKSIELPFPDDPSEFDRIAEIVYQINKSLDSLKEELNKNINLKTGLMQDLLTGKVRVDRLIKQHEEVV